MFSRGESDISQETHHNCLQTASKSPTNGSFPLTLTIKSRFTLKSAVIMAPKDHHERRQQAKIIVGFPGIGKSTLTQKAADGKYTMWNVKQILDEPNYAKGKEDTFLEALLELAKDPQSVLLLPAHQFVSYLVNHHLSFETYK